MLFSMKLLFLASCLLIPFTAVAEEADEKHWIDKKLERDSVKDSSTSGMIEATANAKELWDKEMNEQYQKLIAALDDVSKTKLQESQRAWVVFRDREIENISEFYSKVEGTMYRVSANYAVMEITRRRAMDLSARVKDLEARNR
jgi:uncharacterized protein YecT (DUF1311 family)